MMLFVFKGQVGSDFLTKLSNCDILSIETERQSSDTGRMMNRRKDMEHVIKKFLEVVAEHGSEPAISDESSSFSYGELNG